MTAPQYFPSPADGLEAGRTTGRSLHPVAARCQRCKGLGALLSEDPLGTSCGLCGGLGDVPGVPMFHVAPNESYATSDGKYALVETPFGWTVGYSDGFVGRMIDSDPENVTRADFEPLAYGDTIRAALDAFAEWHQVQS